MLQLLQVTPRDAAPLQMVMVSTLRKQTCMLVLQSTTSQSFKELLTVIPSNTLSGSVCHMQILAHLQFWLIHHSLLCIGVNRIFLKCDGFWKAPQPHFDSLPVLFPESYTWKRNFRFFFFVCVCVCTPVPAPPLLWCPWVGSKT